MDISVLTYLQSIKWEKTDYVGLILGHNTDKSKVFKTFFGKVDKAPLIRGLSYKYALQTYQNS